MRSFYMMLTKMLFVIIILLSMMMNYDAPVMLCYVIWLFVKCLSQKAIQSRIVNDADDYYYGDGGLYPYGCINVCMNNVCMRVGLRMHV